MTLPKPYMTPERGHAAAALVQLGIRLKYLALTWGGLEPFVRRSWTGHPASGWSDPDPELRALTAFGIKACWAIAGAARSLAPIGPALYRFSGARRLTIAAHRAFYRDVIRTWRDHPTAGSRVPLPEFDWRREPPEVFIERFVRRPHPVVLRGFAEQTQAARTWTFERLLERYGDEEVLLTVDRLDGYPGPLREVERSDVYLHNSEALFRRHPQLLDELELERLAPYSDMRPTHAHLFLGRQGTGTPFHAASTWNWFFNLHGRKKWWFVAPQHGYLLYPFALLGRAAGFALCRYPDDYDREFFPAFQYCPIYEITLEPGDVLFNPPWWWHAIRNETDQTLGVATRWIHAGQVGRRLNMIEEDYAIDRMRSWMFFAGPASLGFLHHVLRQPSPAADAGTTLRERKVRFGHVQRQMSTEVVFGVRHQF